MRTFITRRDVAVALGTVLVTVGAAALAQSAGPGTGVMRSTVWDWNAIPMSKTAVGETRPVVRRPTATLEELEMHVTTLNPGQTSHAPHHHGNEELVLIDKGTVEVFVHGEWKRIGPGSIVFNAANESHALRNVGAEPTQYHVINWKTPATPSTSATPTPVPVATR